MAKRGRPRKKPEYRDKGTPELQMRRMVIVNGGNTDKASDPLDAMEERGIITNEMAKAGHNYARLYYRTFGTPFIHVNYDKLLTKAVTSKSFTKNPSRNEAENEWILGECFKILKDLNGSTRKAVDRIALRKVFPNFLYESKSRIKDNHFKQSLQRGLKELDKWFSKAKKSYHGHKKKK
mgnify:CR=1 FL=1|tara:strand:- start:326 stop:862 length:537 start_codon:yes stop_codon:yes gene_type:complete